MRRLRLAALLLPLLAATGCTETKTCAVGEVLCGGRCTSVQIDSENCGACGHACGDFQECNAGACECGPGTVECGAGACADLAAHPAHCGACDAACDAGQVCATEGGATACAASCPAGLQACDGGCVALDADRWNCGACGNRCDRGESCREGACKPDLYVACFSTDDVRAANAALRAGLPRAAGDGPIALAVAADRLWAAASLSHSVVSFPLDLRSGGAERVLGGSDLEGLAAHGDRLYVSNAGSNSLVVYDALRARAIDEVVLGPDAGLNPRGVAFVGAKAYVALYGTDPGSGGQELVEVDLDSGEVTARFGVQHLADAPGLAFPSRVVAVGAKVYAALANLKLGDFGYYTDPAGNGKLAVLDTTTGAVGAIDLGASCRNAGGLAVRGSTVWVSCAEAFAGGHLVPVDVSGAEPAIGAPVATGLGAPGAIAFCGDMGYVTDLWSGTVHRFDPAGVAEPLDAEVCPLNASPEQGGWAWAADLACAP